MKKILIYDLETAPLLGYAWGRYEQNLIDVKESGYILCFAYKWLGEKKTKVISLRTEENEEALVKKLWELFDKADVTLAHNGDKYDMRYTNGRFLKYGLPQPSYYETIDTLKISRRRFMLDSNKLDDLGHFLGVGRKLETGGKSLWLRCLKGEEKAWKVMEKYNKQDVELLEAVYNKLVGWSVKNIHVDDDRPTCTACASTELQKRGIEYKGTSKQQRWKCQNCGLNLYTGLKNTLPLKMV